MMISGEKIAQIQSSNMQLSPESPSSKNAETTNFSLHYAFKSSIKEENWIPFPYTQLRNLDKTLLFLSQQI